MFTRGAERDPWHEKGYFGHPHSKKMFDWYPEHKAAVQNVNILGTKISDGT